MVLDEDSFISDTGTNTKPFNPVFMLNTDIKKQRPHNIIINNNRKEPKVKADIKYSNKQNFRRYKTRREPLLKNNITINEEDDIVSKIKEAFGIEEKKNTNYTDVETAKTDYIKIPSNINNTPEKAIIEEREIDELSRYEKEDLTNMSFEDDFNDNLTKYMYDTTNDNSEMKQFFDYDNENKSLKVKRDVLTDDERNKLEKLFLDLEDDDGTDYIHYGEKLHKTYRDIARSRKINRTTDLELVPFPSAPSYPSSPKQSKDDENYLDYMNRYQERLFRPDIPRELRFLERENDAIVPYVSPKFRGRPPIKPEAVSRRAQQQISITKALNKGQAKKDFNVKDYNSMFDTELQKYLYK